jgi:two-component system, OmpR family, sensor histidine kinase KdpD
LLGQRRVEVVIPADLPPVAVNSIPVSEAVFTVIDNAAKFSGPSALIRITAARSGDDVTIDVEDQGQGLPAELGDRIFEKFVRTGSGADGRGSGLGLGLAFARGILEAQHGSIRIGVPREGFTTRFVITIPAARQIADMASNPENV